MRTGGFSEKGQQMGSRWPIGCVALEITQRCNLYAGTQIPSDYRVEFIDYDWTVNVHTATRWVPLSTDFMSRPEIAKAY